MRIVAKGLLAQAKGMKTIVHMNFLTSKQAFALRCLGSTGFVYHVHSNPPARPFLARFGKKMLFDPGTRFLCPSRYTKERAEKELAFRPSRCLVVPNAIDFESLSEDSIAKDLPVLPPCKEKKLLLFGRDPLLKGLDIAIKSALGLRRSGIAVKIFVPASSNSASLTTFLKGIEPDDDPVVELVAPSKNVSGYILSSDLVLVPSRDETFNYTVPESLFLGKAVLVSDIPPFREFGLPEEMVFRSGDVQDFSFKLSNLLMNPLDSGTISKLGHMVGQRFSIDVWSSRIIEQYRLLATR